MRLGVFLQLSTAMSAFALSAYSSVAAAEVMKKAQEADPTSDAIVVTGSRIARPEIAFPNPVTSISAQSIERSGKTDVTSILIDSPALVGSLTNGANAGSNSQNYGGASGAGNVGTSILDLRNLGSQRTLVLIDGRRHVNAYSGENSVDINTIPVDLIEGVDILTGGVSAIYGADGVTGVVNFRLKRNFEGVRARIQAGISSSHDGGNQFASVTAGHNFDSGRGNVTLADRKSTRLNSSHERLSRMPSSA